MTKIEIPYVHDPVNLTTIYLAVGDRRQPLTPWLPAGRDTNADGQRVIWARFGQVPRGVVTVWVRDGDGDRPRISMTV